LGTIDVTTNLEVDWEIVKENEVTGSEEELEETWLPDCMLFEQSSHDHSSIAEPVLPADEERPNESKTNEKTDNFAVAPVAGSAALFKGKDE
jgi:hypothetical protein